MELKIGKYKHYKGKQYEVLGIGKHSETLEDFVIYKALYNSEQFGNNKIWIRPIEMFKGNVIVNNQEIPRFKFIEN